MYAKITKIVEWVLIIIGVGLAVFGLIYGYTTADGIATDILFYCAYALIAIAVLAVVLLGLYFSVKNNPKKLIRIAVGLVIAAAVVGIAYVLAPGTELVGSTIQTTPGILKFTDTILNVAYLSCAGAVIAILFGAVVSAVRNK